MDYGQWVKSTIGEVLRFFLSCRLEWVARSMVIGSITSRCYGQAAANCAFRGRNVVFPLEKADVKQRFVPIAPTQDITPESGTKNCY